MRDALDQGQIEGKVVAPLKKGIFDQVCQFSIKLAYFSSRKRVLSLRNLPNFKLTSREVNLTK